MRPCSRGNAAADFERGYAESVARHKQNAPRTIDALEEAHEQAA